MTLAEPRDSNPSRAPRPNGTPSTSCAASQGLAMARPWASATTVLGLTGALYALGHDGLVYVLGWTGGLVLMMLMVTPHLQGAGRLSMLGFFAERYPGRLPRRLAGAGLALCLFPLLVAQFHGVGLSAARLFGIDGTLAVWVGLATVLTATLVIAMLSRTQHSWRLFLRMEAGLFLLLLAAYVCPLVLLSLDRYGLPVPQLTYGPALAEIVGLEQTFIERRLADASKLKLHTKPFASLDTTTVFALLLCLTAGVAALPHMFASYLTVAPTRTALRHGVPRAAAWGLLWVVALFLTAPAYAAFTKLSVYSTLVGQRLTDVPAWVFVYGRYPNPLKPDSGLVDICGKAATDLPTILKTCGASHLGIVRLQDVAIHPDVLVLATPEIANLPFAITLLVGIAALIASLAGAESVMRTLGGRAFSRDRSDDASLTAGAGYGGPAWVAVTWAFGFALLAATVATQPPADIITLASWSFSLAAAGLFPALILGLWWRQATAWGCILGVITGFAVTLYYILGTRAFAPQFYETWSFLSSAAPNAALKFAALKKAWLAAADGPAREAAWIALNSQAQSLANWWGIKPIAAGVFGMVAGFAAFVLGSLLLPIRVKF